jgi:hypothetical protein
MIFLIYFQLYEEGTWIFWIRVQEVRADQQEQDRRQLILGENVGRNRWDSESKSARF